MVGDKFLIPIAKLIIELVDRLKIARPWVTTKWGYERHSISGTLIAEVRLSVKSNNDSVACVLWNSVWMTNGSQNGRWEIDSDLRKAGWITIN